MRHIRTIRKDLTGKTFGHLKVLSVGSRTKNVINYKCLCMPCNEVYEFTYTNLKSGNSVQCSSCAKTKFPYWWYYAVDQLRAKGFKPKAISDILQISFEIARTLYKTSVKKEHAKRVSEMTTLEELGCHMVYQRNSEFKAWNGYLVKSDGTLGYIKCFVHNTRKLTAQNATEWANKNPRKLKNSDTGKNYQL